MISTAGLEAMKTVSPELNWQTVKKGRRTQKSIARSFTGVAKVGNSSPKRVGDFSGSDSEKSGGKVKRQVPDKSEQLPLKKRRHPLSHCQDSPSLQEHSSSPLSDDQDKHSNPNSSSDPRSSSSYSNWQLRGIEGLARAKFSKGIDNGALCDRTEGKNLYAEDFSGIQLLAEAASMEETTDNCHKENIAVKESLMPEDSNAPSTSNLSEAGLKCNESGNPLNNATLHGDNANCSSVLNTCSALSESPHRSVKDVTTPSCVPFKVDRRHWDLNTLMEAWEEPLDDSIAGSSLKGAANCDMHMEGRQEEFDDRELSKSGGAGIVFSKVKREDKNLEGISTDRTSTQTNGPEKCSLKLSNKCYSIVVGGNLNQAIKRERNENNSDKAFRSNNDIGTSDQVTKTDAILYSSSSKLSCSSSMLMSEGKGNVSLLQDEDCSSNVSECYVTTLSGIAQTRTLDVTAYDVLATEVSASTIVDPNDTRDSQKDFNLRDNTISSLETVTSGTCKREYIDHSKSNSDNSKSNSDEMNCFSSSSNSGNFPASETFAPDGCAVLADSMARNDGTSVTNFALADCHGQFEVDGFVPKCEDNELPSSEGSERNKFVGSCNSYSARPPFDNPIISVGKLDSITDVCPDSPYEDGELRVSFSWEENDECVDYDSDPKTGGGSDAGDCVESQIVEGGSEGSHGAETNISLIGRSSEGKVSKSHPVNNSLKRHFVNGDSAKNETGTKKDSNGGSGTTFERSMETLLNENNDIRKRRYLTDRRYVVGGGAHTGEYKSRMAGGKLQSRIERRSSLDTTDGKDASFLRHCRFRDSGGSYYREKDTGLEKYPGRCSRPVTPGLATHGSERVGVDRWTNWDSKRQHTSTYQGAEGRKYTRPRNSTGDLADKFGGVDFHEERRNGNYLPRSFHKPFGRMRSPVDGDDCFGTDRRVPLARRVDGYASRGYFPRGPRRDLGEEYEIMHSDAAEPVHFPRHLSRRQQSFSPNRGAHVPFTRRRSRSRSGTHSPRDWHSSRERGNRRQSRSPVFRSDGRMGRMKVPFQKPNYAPDYTEGYLPQPRGRISPRWVDNRDFAEQRFRHRRSPSGVIQKFDDVDSEQFRPIVRPRRFPLVANDGRESKFGNSYNERKCEDQRDMIHQGRQPGDGDNTRRFRLDASDNNFEKEKAI